MQTDLDRGLWNWVGVLASPVQENRFTSLVKQVRPCGSLYQRATQR
jgi:hypothetical protein